MIYRILPVLVVLALLLSASDVRSAPPKPDFTDFPAYLQALNQSRDPVARAIRRQIADGPVALARQRDLARKEGLAVSPAQLNRPLPPPDQNAAPLYLQAAAQRRGRVILPAYAETLSARYAYTPKQLARIQNIYDKNPDVFALLHQATARPQCVFVQDWTQDALTVSFQQFTGLRETARELKTEAVLLAEQGRFSDAVAADSRVYRVAEHAAAQPTLISYLVGTAIDAIATGGMQDILALAGPKADVDAQVGQALTDRGAHLSLRHGLSGEIAMGDAGFALLRNGGAGDFRSLFTETASLSPKPPFTADERRAYRNLLDAAEADYIARMRRVVAAADTPGEAAAFARAGRDVAADTDNPVQLLSDKLSGFQFDTLNDLPQRSAALRAVTQAVAAVLAEKARTGKYPYALPGKIPDPYSGNPLGYHRERTGGFVVYSVGPVGAFHGGKPGDKMPPGQIWFRYPVKPVPVPPDMLK